MELFRLLARRRGLCQPDNQQFTGRKARWVAVTTAFLILVAAMPGCKKQAEGPSAEIRLIDTVPDADDVRFYVANKSPLGTTPYGGASKYLKIPVGSYDVKVAAEKDGATLSYFSPLTLDAEPDHKYTGIAVGNALTWPHASVVLFDDNGIPDSEGEKASIRVVDAYPHSTKVDVTINNVVAFHDLSFGSQSKSLSFPAGLSEIKSIEAGTYSDTMAGPVPVQLDQGKSYLLVVLGQDTPTQAGILVIPDN